MDQLPLRALYYGVDEPLPEPRLLRAGPLTVLYEEGRLRHIRVSEGEVLRQIYVAVRDRDWKTPQPRLSNVRIDEHPMSFRIAFDAEDRQGEIDFAWHGTITGDEQGSITFTMDGEARSTFLRNRIGFCVLHPIETCAGRPFTAHKVDGSVEHGTFPRYIAPHQPIRDMRAILYELSQGIGTQIRFGGDVFETEDQRNWTDNSFKTYSTPLRISIPVEIKGGTRISQSITVSIRGEVSMMPPEQPSPTLTIGPAPVAVVPRLGLGMASDGNPLSERELARLRALNLSHLRVDLRLSDPAYPLQLRHAAAVASAVGVPLEAAIFLSDAAEDELKSLARHLGELKPPVCTWLVFHAGESSTSVKWVEMARAHLADYDPQARLGSGTNGDFVQLNRGRPPRQALDLACYSLNPQVHTYDNRSMVENLQGQAWQLDSARQFLADTPIAVTPIILRPRLNSHTGVPSISPGGLPSSVDPRQMSLFGAAWTAGSLKYISEHGAYSATYYETTGWRGVMETEAGSPMPEKFPSLPGAVFPLYHVLADFGEFAGGEVIPVATSDALQVNGMALRRDGRMRVIAANMCPDRQQVSIRGLGHRVLVKLLDEATARQAMASPEEYRAAEGARLPTVDGELEIELLPYAVVRIDSAEGQER